MSTWTCAKCGAFGPLNDWNIDKAECGVDGCDGARAHTARELSFAREASACRFEMHHLDAQLAEASKNERDRIYKLIEDADDNDVETTEGLQYALLLLRQDRSGK